MNRSSKNEVFRVVPDKWKVMIQPWIRRVCSKNLLQVYLPIPCVFDQQNSVIKIVREKYLNTTAFTDKEKLQAFLSELYVFLIDQMHVALNKVIWYRCLLLLSVHRTNFKLLKKSITSQNSCLVTCPTIWRHADVVILVHETLLPIVRAAMFGYVLFVFLFRFSHS